MLPDSAKIRIFVVCLILIATLCIFADNRPASGPDWQTVNYCNSTTAYGRVLLDGGDASIEDIVAAFVQGECRGVQHVNIMGGLSYVTLEINGEFVEEVDFAIYDVSENLIYIPDFSTNTSPGNSIGYPPNFLPLFADSPNANHLLYLNLPDVIELESPEDFTWLYGIDFFDQDNDLLYLDASIPEEAVITQAAPDWVPVSSSGVTMMYGEVYISGEPAEPGDILGAFVQGECRAVTEVYLWENIPFAALSVYGINVMPVSFRIHDVSAGSTWQADLIVNSQPGGMIGYPDLLNIEGVNRILESDLCLSIEYLPEQNEVVSISLSDFPPISTVRQDIILDVGSANLPPVLALPAISFYEDNNFQLNLDEYATDPENNELDFQVVNNSPVQSQMCQNILHLQPPADWYGTAFMQIFATDGGRLYCMDTLFVEVIPVNDPPVLIVPDQLVFSEDTIAHLDLSSSYDIDGDSLEIIFADQEILDIQAAAPLWQPVIYNNSSYAYLQLSFEGENLSDGSLIAAFAGNECRGRAITYLYQNHTYAIFPIYCQITALVTFKAYDAINEIIFSSNPVSVNPGSNLGFPPDYYQLEFVRAEIPRIFQLSPPENWNGAQNLELTLYDPSQAFSSENILIIVTAEPDAPLVEEDILLNFAASSEDWVDLEEYIYDPDGDEFSLLIIDAAGMELSAEGSILNISSAPAETGIYQIAIRVEDSTGLTADVDIEIEILPEYTFERALVPGWNWFSLAAGTNHFEPNVRLAFLEDSADILKGQTGFLNYYTGVGWAGSLMNISPLSLFKTHLLEPAVYQPQGWLLDAAETPIAISAGWNWISYIPSQIMSLNEALAPLAGNLDYIKSQNGYALYYNTTGWIGPLQNLYPSQGYVVHAQYDQIFHYPLPTRSAKAENVKIEKNPPIKTADYEYTSSLTAVIPDYVPQPGDELFAFAGSTIAGYASIEANSVFDLRAELGEFYYFLYLYTNLIDPADLHFQLCLAESGKVLDLPESVCWSPETNTGDLENPVILHISADQPLEEIENEMDIRLYPNPVFAGSNRSQLKINLPPQKDNKSIKAGLYNMRGQKVAVLDLKYSNDNWVILSANNWDYPNGIYLFRLVTDNLNYQTKLLILK